MALWKTHYKTPYGIEARHDQLLDLEPELLILNEMVSDLDISLHMSGFPYWVVQIYCLEILHPRQTVHPHVWWFSRVISVVVPEKFSMVVIPSSSTLSLFNFSAKAFSA